MAVVVMTVSWRAGAVNLHALYTASCQREVGIILDVTPRQVLLLNTKGDIVAVERFEVIYYASYPLDTVPAATVRNPEKVPLVEIKTFQNNSLATLVRGWPVDFSKDKIAFLSLRGSEVMIDRTSIWQVNFDRESTVLQFLKRPDARYEFIHPYAFTSCSPETVGSGAKFVRVAPQQLLSDPISIKREFDRLAEGHDQVKRYESDQQFYAVPELYNNETSLGMWLSTGSRYGASSNRQSNFTPLLINQTSFGPFSFQSEFRTGAGPILQTIHEEAQSQAYYRMKADYFHFSGFVDPNLLLVGSKYKWFSQDMDNVDIRANESASLEFGFDYGRIALEFYVGGALNIGARNGVYFQRKTMSLPRLGLRYQNFHWIGDIQWGQSSRGGFDASLLRANLQWLPSKNSRWVFSIIQRDLLFDGDAGVTSPVTIQVQNESTTFAGYGYFRFKTRYWAGGMIALEKVAKTFSAQGSNDSESKVFPKVGAMISLSF